MTPEPFVEHVDKALWDVTKACKVFLESYSTTMRFIKAYDMALSESEAVTPGEGHS